MSDDEDYAAAQAAHNHLFNAAEVLAGEVDEIGFCLDPDAIKEADALRAEIVALTVRVKALPRKPAPDPYAGRIYNL